MSSICKTFVLKKRLDLGFGDGRDVMKFLLVWFGDLGALIMPRSPTKVTSPPEARGDFVDLGGHGFRIEGVAGEDFDRQRHAAAVARQTADDLLFAAFAVAVVAEGSERVVPAFEMTAGHVVEETRGLFRGVVFFEKPQLDVALVFALPGEMGVKMVFVEVVDGPGDDLSKGELALAVVAEGGGGAEFSGQALQDGSDTGALAQGDVGGRGPPVRACARRRA
jgi:hypothetical protein